MILKEKAPRKILTLKEDFRPRRKPYPILTFIFYNIQHD